MASKTGTDGGSATVTDQVQETTQHLSQKAQETAQQAVEQARSQAGTQLHSVGSNIGSVAQSLRDTSNKLNQQGQQPAAKAVKMAADRLDSVSSYVQNTSVDEMLGQAQDFARRDPAIFLGGAFGLGLLLSRFLKSSKPTQSPGSRTGYTPQYSSAGAYDPMYNTYGSGTLNPDVGVDAYEFEVDRYEVPYAARNSSGR